MIRYFLCILCIYVSTTSYATCLEKDSLTEEEISAYNEEGYLILRQVFDDREVELMQIEADKAIDIAFGLGSSQPANLTTTVQHAGTTFVLSKKGAQIQVEKISVLAQILPNFNRFGTTLKLKNPLQQALNLDLNQDLKLVDSELSKSNTTPSQEEEEIAVQVLAAFASIGDKELLLFPRSHKNSASLHNQSVSVQLKAGDVAFIHPSLTHKKKTEEFKILIHNYKLKI